MSLAVRPYLLWAGVAALFLFLYSLQLGAAGVLGPDEPRYASIGRAMAQSGDWLTPRLWGDPWFEKPPLAYWLSAAGHTLGFEATLAARAGNVAVSALFLAFFGWMLSRLLSRPAALASTAMLATSAGWLAYTHVAVTDVPMTAAYTLAMLAALIGLRDNRPAWLRASGLLFGVAVLGKSLVPLALALPLVWFFRRDLRRLLVPVLLGLAVSAPWYIWMSLRFGRTFFDELILKHHLSRLYSDGLQHVQPWWFYLPVTLGLLFPWTTLPLALRARMWRGLPNQFLSLWALWVLVFFSISTNKLPGYVLPALPALCALFGGALESSRAGRWPLAMSGILLALVPAINGVLPDALLHGLTKSRMGQLPWEYIALALPIAAGALWLAGSGRAHTAVLVVAIATALCAVYIKLSIYPVLDQIYSGRGIWRQIAGQPDQVCIESLERDWRYGLNYYSVTPLPDCSVAPKPVRIVHDGLPLPRVEP